MREITDIDNVGVSFVARPLPSAPWYAVHDNLVTLTSWMADEGYDGSEIAHAVEKPWNYEDEFKQAQREASE